MTDYVDSWPTARRRHRCGVCCRSTLPGETYWRQASLDHGQAWTHKTCERCERVACAFCRVTGESEWDGENADVVLAYQRHWLRHYRQHHMEGMPL